MYNLGSVEHHTVYKAELTGMLLALHRTNNMKKLKRLTIFADNQAAIKALSEDSEGIQMYLMTKLNNACRQFKKKHKGVVIELQWVPGH